MDVIFKYSYQHKVCAEEYTVIIFFFEGNVCGARSDNMGFSCVKGRGWETWIWKKERMKEET